MVHLKEVRRENRRMERFPTKSVILERAETVGSVGFLISSCVVGSSPISGQVYFSAHPLGLG